MSSALSPDLFPTIFLYLSSKDLEACSLINQFFRDLAQATLFSNICLMKHYYSRNGGKLATKLDFYLDDARGRALCLQAKALMLQVEFIDEEAPRIVSFIQNTQNISSLSFAPFNSPWSQLNTQILDSVRIHTLPHIHHLHITAAFELEFGEFLTGCKVLRHLELHQSHLDIENEKFQVRFPTLRHLTFEDWTFHPHRGLLNVDACLAHTKQDLRSLSLNIRSYPGGQFGSFLQGFTSLESLFWGSAWYLFIVFQSGYSYMSLPDVSQLRKLTFQMEPPRHRDWGRFFSWIGKLIKENSLTLPEVCFESEHPAFTRSGKSTFKESRHDSFDEFNALAGSSALRLKIILRSSAPDHKEAFQQYGFEHIAALVKQWLSSWDNLGKLEIYRR
ncbi:hypothetical protein DL96DRAFT_1580593 [Flagelloscypha sp. PMI_526]|nr:hypothetical protein DL96DRAFT_1580593 [Flagelloscypha sp. PMI_526]